MMGIDTWRYHANRWQTWLALALLTLWVVLYAIATVGHPEAYHSSSGYWPSFQTGFSIPYQGGEYHMANPNQAAAAPAPQMALVGEHNGVRFYAPAGPQVGGGGGYAGPIYPRLYVQTRDGKWIPLERQAVDPNAGRFMR